MNKAIIGNKEEVLYTRLLNKKTEFWNVLGYAKANTFAIHVNSKKYGKINDAKVSAKADIFFATGNVDSGYLFQNNYYLDENDCNKFGLQPIAKSGLSIKLSNSKYTITKISPSTFKKIFNDNILGAGASIYCKSEKEFAKNPKVLLGWGIDKSAFISFFKQNLKVAHISLENKELLSKIKSYSNGQISRLILGDKTISDFIFKGIGNFEEPYTAHWIIENEILKPNYYIPFSITTGSGRSKGIYTIVLKPK